MDQKVLWQISYGLYAIGVMDDERPTGCVVNTVIQATSENPTIALCINKENHTMDVMQKNPRFAVSILAENVDRNTIAFLGFRSGRDHDKFKDVPHEIVDGAPVVSKGITGYLICDMLSFTENGTHNVIVAKVVGAEVGDSTEPPMTYKYYHEVVKGKAPKNAPTYRAPEEK